MWGEEEQGIVFSGDTNLFFQLPLASPQNIFICF